MGLGGKSSNFDTFYNFVFIRWRELPAAVKVYTMTSDKSIYVPNGSELLRFRFDG